MNRAERRRKERIINKKTGLTKAQIDIIKQEAADEAFDRVFGVLFTLPLMVLRENYGFGKKRLQRFNDQMTDKLKEVEQGKLELNDLVDYLRDKFNIVFTERKDEN